MRKDHGEQEKAHWKVSNWVGKFKGFGNKLSRCRKSVGWGTNDGKNQNRRHRVSFREGRRAMGDWEIIKGASKQSMERLNGGEMCFIMILGRITKSGQAEDST